MQTKNSSGAGGNESRAVTGIAQTVLKLRECSNVQRCHTIPHRDEYTVGKHSHDALVLLLTLFPNISRDAIVAMTYHDYAERWVGDMPCTAGWDDVSLGTAYRRAEAAVFEQEGVDLPFLHEVEDHILRVVDKLELWLWSMEQLAHGNVSVNGCLNRLNDYFEGLSAQERLPEPVAEVLREYRWRRTS